MCLGWGAEKENAQRETPYVGRPVDPYIVSFISADIVPGCNSHLDDCSEKAGAFKK